MRLPTNFTGAQWCLIDLASQYGMAKEHYDVRLKWGQELLPMFRTEWDEFVEAIKPFVETADEPELFSASAINVWRVCHGKLSRYAIGQDAVASGPQILSCISRCEIGMKTTGLINGEEVPDLYTGITKALGSDESRSQVKKATVPHVYASIKAPMAVYGERYPEFVEAYTAVLPMAEAIKNRLVAAWNPRALFHSWEAPDGFEAVVPVIGQKSIEGKFRGFKYTYIYKAIMAKSKGLGVRSLAANFTHTLDGYVLRELARRCDYNKKQLLTVSTLINQRITNKLASAVTDVKRVAKAMKLVLLSRLNNLVSLVGVEYVTLSTIKALPLDYLLKLQRVIKRTLRLPSFKLKIVHDDFGAIGNYINALHYHYNSIMASLYMSDVLNQGLIRISGRGHGGLLNEAKLSHVKEIMRNKYAIG